MDILFIFLAFIIGAVLVYFLQNQKINSFNQKNTQLQERNSNLNAELENLKENIIKLNLKTTELTTTNTSLNIQNAELTTKLAEQENYYKKQIEFLKATKEDITKDFKAIANLVLETEGKNLNTKNKDILEPLKTEIKGFKERIETITKEQIEERTSLKDQITNLQAANLEAQETTKNLTDALTKDNKQQGNWGEIVLENILTESNLREGYEYDIQKQYKNKDGKRYTPDVIVHLPDNKDIIIDAKVSLKAYKDYQSETDKDKRKKHLAAHIKSIEAHIKNISLKQYENLEGIKTLDFIFVFMPIEPALLVALSNKNAIFKEALNKNIMLTSPSTLLMSLKIVNHIWQNEKQNKNSEEIAKQAGAMYDKFYNFINSLEDINKHINKAQESYNKAHNQLSTGRGNLVSRADKLKELGVQTKKKLDN